MQKSLKIRDKMSLAAHLKHGGEQHEQKGKEKETAISHQRKSKRLPSLTVHFLYQKRHWKQGYAKALRNHWYCGAYIPKFTLHRAIHSKLHDVPVPNGKDCKRAYEELIRRENEGVISKNDTPMQRLAFLIEMFSDTCPATTAILVWQLQIVTKFYENVP